jgi:hypothetical protein
MKNPFNILNGTIFVIILSIIGLIVLIIFSQSLDFGLTREDYYEQDLKYQSQIERIERTINLIEPVDISIMNNILQIKFPDVFDSKEVSGTIQLFRPSDPNLDRTIPLELDTNGIQNSNISALLNGLWIVKMNWVHSGSEYYMEKRIFIKIE